MGLQTTEVQAGRSTFLTVTGGFIWDKKQGEDHPQFKVQEYRDNNDEVATRQGACYPSLTGQIVDVRINEHDKFGQSVQVTFASEGDRYIISIGTNNKFSQDMMKMLLKVDLLKEVHVKPYEFMDKQKNKRVQGIVFRQDGEKIVLRNEEAPFKDSEFFAKATKKQKSRFFEDLTEWFVESIQEQIIDVSFAKDESGNLITPVALIKEVTISDSMPDLEEAPKKAPAKKAAVKKAVKKEISADDLDAEFEEMM
jgi:hypothetical protein